MQNTSDSVKRAFTRYEILVIAILAFLQFTVILDFMVISPLGAFMMPDLKIDSAQFGWVVSAYALSAGASGLLAAGFADRFDRKKLLLFFYTGFLIGTFLCAIAPGYHALLGARILTGIFGGVLNSIGAAIVTDLFPMQMRGRVMGFVQMAFASSQVLGLPLGLFIAERFGWHASFLVIVAVGVPVGIIALSRLRPINAHLLLKTEHSAFQHLIRTLKNPRYVRGFAATTLLATGGFMLMPFGSAFATGNLGIKTEQLPLLYTITGLAALVAGPLAGRLADQLGKYRLFAISSFLGMGVVIFYTQLGPTPFWLLATVSAVMFVFITGRIIGASALITGIPKAQDRGAYMGLSSAMQQIAGGISAAIAGLIVVRNPNGTIAHYATLGYVVVGAMAVTIVLMYFIHRIVRDPALQDLPVVERQ